MKPNFYMMVGLPGSGKSTYAEKLEQVIDVSIISSDSIREELYNDASIQGDNNEVFAEVHKRIIDNLTCGNSVIYDACNISYKRRKAFLNEIKGLVGQSICILIATPVFQCMKNNANRDRQVPNSVINRMLQSFNIPYYYEGWDTINIVYSKEALKLKGRQSPKDFAVLANCFEHDNPHHKNTVGMHCYKMAHDFPINSIKYNICMLHDCGKLYTKSFKDSKGADCKEAHYYNHQYVGAYDSLFYNTNGFDLLTAVVIMWHMQPFFNNTDSLKDKYETLWGKGLTDLIYEIHEKDIMYP